MWNRRPYLVSIEQFGSWLWVLLAYFGLPCIVTQAASLLTLTIILFRTIYVYQYLVAEPKQPFKFICSLFWRRNSLKVWNALVFVLIFEAWRVVIILAVTFTYRPNFMERSCVEASTHRYLTNLLSIPMDLVILFVFIFAVSMFMSRVNDKIGMKYEFGFSSSISLILLLIFNIAQEFFDYPYIWGAFAQVVNLHFWAVWVPMYFVYKHNKKMKKIYLSGEQYDMQSLLLTSRQFFCEENVLFIQYYRNYMSLSSFELYDEIIRLFIAVDAKYELNIGEFERTEAALSPKGLDQIYLDVIELIYSNVLPYIADKNESDTSWD